MPAVVSQKRRARQGVGRLHKHRCLEGSGETTTGVHWSKDSTISRLKYYRNYFPTLVVYLVLT